MAYAGLEDMLRRIVTADQDTGASFILVDGAPSSSAAEPGVGGLLEIWAESLAAPLRPSDQADFGPAEAMLSPPAGGVKVRWFIVEPTPDGVPKPMLDAAAKAAFARIGADHHMIDQTRHHAMHETDTLDVICLLQGEASLILEDGETRIKPGQVVIQRGTNHAWAAHGGPALFLAVLIDRAVVR